MQKTIVILGLGISGKASAAFLLAKGERVIGADRNADRMKGDSSIVRLMQQGMELVSDDAKIDSNQIILSPGIPSTHPMVQRARNGGIEVIGEIEMGFRYLKNRAVGVTGTNGKTTTVMLIAHLLQSAGMKARALGNIGASLAEYLLHPDPDEILVIELSSFQLETASTPALESAAILNITPNHLNWHPTLEDYARAKARIGLCVKNGPLFVSNQAAKEYSSLFETLTLFDQETVAPNSQLRYIMRGLPERKNVEAAFAFCAYFGIDRELCERNLETFKKPSHRIEWVAKKNHVSYFNDSKASNIHAVMHAVSLFETPLVLIAGGVHKGASYSPWIAPFRGKVKGIVAFGEASGQMEAELSRDFPVFRVNNLEEAVLKASKLALENEIVLLSPGCSSYDQFRSFEHRGDEFKRIVREELK